MARLVFLLPRLEGPFDLRDQRFDAVRLRPRRKNQVVQHWTVQRQRSYGQRGSAPHRSLRGLRRGELHPPPRRGLAAQGGGRGKPRAQPGTPPPLLPPYRRNLVGGG